MQRPTTILKYQKDKPSNSLVSFMQHMRRQIVKLLSYE